MAAGDVVVVIPGILGSTLYRSRRQTWGYRQILFNVHRLTQKLTDDLCLPPEAFDDPREGIDDGTVPVRCLESARVIPGFWGVEGYDRLLRLLRDRLPDTSNLDIHAFPYDWRQSNEYSAARLQKFIEPILHERRKTYPSAGLIIIGHSMGGLIGQFYAECLDTDRLTRRLITIGTPYQGAVKALVVLGNKNVSLGPITVSLGDVVSTFPSVAELLPMYPCIKGEDSHLGRLDDGRFGGLSPQAWKRGRDFHATLTRAIAANNGSGLIYHAILSHRQPTETWVSLSKGIIHTHRTTDVAWGGDGTVPRCSATPRHWEDDSAGSFVAGRHATLQQRSQVIRQLDGILTSRPKFPQTMSDEISVDITEGVMAHTSLPVLVRSMEGSDSLALTFTLVDAGTARPILTVPLRPTGSGTYRGSVVIREPGLYRWEIACPPTAATPVSSISDVLMCFTD